MKKTDVRCAFFAEERVDYLESAIGDSADKHARELENLKTVHSRLQTESKAKELSVCFQRMRAVTPSCQEAHHANVVERLTTLEKTIGESADKHAQDPCVDGESSCGNLYSFSIGCCQELAAAHGKIASMHTRLSTCEATGLQNTVLAGSKQASIGSYGRINDRWFEEGACKSCG